MSILIDESKFNAYSDTDDSVVADFEEFYDLFQRIIEVDDTLYLHGLTPSLMVELRSIAGACKEQVEWMEANLTYGGREEF